MPSEASVEQAYSLAIADAQRSQDLALASAQHQNILDQTAADNTQRQSDAAANAALLSAQYAAKVPAMQVLASDIAVGAGLQTAPSWAEYQIARAAVEEAAWDGTGPASSLVPSPQSLAPNYISWQQQVSNAYTTYAGARSTSYYTQAADIAQRTYTDAQNSANRTAQEVATLAGDELSFEQDLAQKVFDNREALATADRAEANGLAAAARDGTTYSSHLLSDQQAATAAYQTGYVTRDGQRRHDMAQAGLNFVTDLAGYASTAANFIASDEAGFDNAVANAYYQGSGAGGQGSGLEFTLATLAKSYDIAYATTFATALSNLATAATAAGSGGIVAGVPDAGQWALLASVAAQQAQAHLTAADIPAADATFAARVAQAVQDNTANLPAGSTDRGQWLGDLTTQSNLAIAAAQAARDSSNVGGNLNSVTPPGDLTVPDVDLGSVVAVSSWSQFWNDQVPAPGSLELMGWFDPYGPYQQQGYSKTWGDPWVYAQFDYSGGYYQWFNSGAYGWNTAYAGGNLGWWNSVGYGWWTDAGMAAPSWAVFDPLAQGYYNDAYFANGFGGYNYGTIYGASFGYWPNLGSGGFSWLPGYSGLPTTPASVDPNAAVQAEQTAIGTLTALATVGQDVLQIVKNLAPLSIDPATSVATVAAGAGFPALSVGTDGGAQQSAQGNGSGAPGGTPLSEWIRDDFDRMRELEDQIDEGEGTPEAYEELNRLQGFYLPGGTTNVVTSVTGDPVWKAMTFNDFAGQRWDGRTVLEIIKAYEGENAELVANFVASHFKLHVANDYSSPFWAFVREVVGYPFPDPSRRPDAPQLEIKGFGGKGITTVNDIASAAEAHATIIDVGIPDSWDSARVAQYILQSMGADPVINKIAEDEFAGRSATILAQLQEAAFATATAEAALIIGMYYKMLASLAPGGPVSVAVYAVEQGDLFGAALEVLFMGPVAKLAGKAVKYVTAKVGGNIVAHIPVASIKAFQEIGAVEKEELIAGLRAAKTEEEATAQLAKILKRCNGEYGLLVKNGLNEFTDAWRYGFQPYGKLWKQLSGTGLKAHHLLPQRFAKELDMEINEMTSIALNDAEHQVFTNAWRNRFPYGAPKPTRQQILDAAREIYKGYPDILRVLGF